MYLHVKIPAALQLMTLTFLVFEIGHEIIWKIFAKCYRSPVHFLKDNLNLAIFSIVR